MWGSPSSGRSSSSCLYILPTVASARRSILPRSSDRDMSESRVPTLRPCAGTLNGVQFAYSETVFLSCPVSLSLFTAIAHSVDSIAGAQNAEKTSSSSKSRHPDRESLSL